MKNQTISRFIVIVISLCGYSAKGQFVYFDKMYDSGLSNNQSEGIWDKSIHELSDGFLFVSFTMNNTSTVRGIWLIKTDFFGDTNWTVKYVDTAYYETPQTMVQTCDENYVITSSITEFNSNNPSDIALTKINNSGDIIWKKQYGSDTLYEVTSHLIKTIDCGFAAIGQRTINQENADVYLIKTDSIGNQLWEKQYGGIDYEAGNSLIQTPDSGFLLLGWTRSFGNGQRDWYLIKADSLGNQQWQRTYGDANNQSGNGIIALDNGNYIMSGGGGNNNARIIKIDGEGNTIWNETYAYTGSDGNYLFWPKELPDKSIIAVGLTNKASESDAGWLIKVDSSGNELWQRKYNYNSNTDLFYTVLPTSDGGFLLGGQAKHEFPLTQDAWLLKVDSEGCPYPNCTVGIDENNRTKVIADIYPNPAIEVLNIEFQNAEDYTITLTDINGRAVYSAGTNKETLITIDVSSFANGVYLLQLVGGQSVVNKKVIIQH